jgi:hypothetical protein
MNPSTISNVVAITCIKNPSPGIHPINAAVIPTTLPWNLLLSINEKMNVTKCNINNRSNGIADSPTTNTQLTTGTQKKRLNPPDTNFITVELDICSSLLLIKPLSAYRSID